MEVKISNFKNHQRFLLKCLNKGVVPFSLRLKKLIRTQKGKGIMYKAEINLLNEIVRNISSTIDQYEHEKYMYQNQVKQSISQEMLDLCMAEIHRVIDLRHVKVMNRQISKFEKLLKQNNCKDQGGHSKHDQNGCSNQDGLEITKIVPKKWVINLSNTPLTQEQDSLLSHGPNFAVTP